MSAINQSIAPRVLFTGTTMDYWKEFCLHSGDCCEIYNRMDNMSKSRSVPCIALYTCNNAVRSWAFKNLVSRKIIRRSQWVKMVTTEEIINRMTAFDPVRCDSGDG
jgi:hypothetical protein